MLCTISYRSHGSGQPSRLLREFRFSDDDSTMELAKTTPRSSKKTTPHHHYHLQQEIQRMIDWNLQKATFLILAFLESETAASSSFQLTVNIIVVLTMLGSCEISGEAFTRAGDKLGNSWICTHQRGTWTRRFGSTNIHVSGDRDSCDSNSDNRKEVAWAGSAWLG